MTVPYGNVSDPLSLGTLYECTRENAGGTELENKDDIPNSTGGFLQGDSRVRIENLEVEYYLHDGATLLEAGDTVNGYFVDSCVPGKGARAHDTMVVRAHKRENVVVTDEVVS